MDSLDRLFRHLVRTIRASYPQYLSQPFEVAELYQTIMPYRHHRRELGLDTNQDYEMALLELLSGARGLLVVDDQMRDALKRELASANPDPGAFREFATAQVALSPDAVRQINAPAEAGVTATARASAVAAEPTRAQAAPRPAVGRAGAAPTAATTGPTGAARAPSAAVETPITRASAPTIAVTTPHTSNGIAVGNGETCRYCGGDLPEGRRVVFCPHCGQNLTVVNCLACGTELELGWKFCTSCGRPTASAGAG
jgi:hypothetical protein